MQAELPGCLVGTLEQVLADPSVDLVVIAAERHHAPAREALLAGKHVVIDKPFALDLAEAKALVETGRASSSGCSASSTTGAGTGTSLTVRRLLADGVLGRIAPVRIPFRSLSPRGAPALARAGGPGSGLWFDLGPHILVQSLQLFGQPGWIQADLARQRPGP